MKLIVINALSALRGGGQTYLINFIENLPHNQAKLVIITNSANHDVFRKYNSPTIKVIEIKAASKNIILRCIWEIFYLPLFLKKNGADVYYAPGGIMLTKMPKGVTSATALRNMLPFDKKGRKRFSFFSYERFKFWLLRFVFLASYKISDKVLFISNHSREVIRQIDPNIMKKSCVIPHGLNSKFKKNSFSTNFSLPSEINKNEFYLYVSILDVYKAQKEVVLAWKILDEKNFIYPLVLAGPKYNEYGDDVLRLIEDLGLTNKVIYLGNVEYEYLPDLYKSARGLIFASSCECCPNILLEKLSSGKPVFSSNIAPMPEFGEDAALYFNPYEPTSLVDQIKKQKAIQVCL